MPPGSDESDPDAAQTAITTPTRPQFVKRGDPTVWVTKAFLRSRGWTDAAIRDFLPEPEALKPNPRFAATGAPMPVWKPATVAAAENEPDWQAWLEKSLHRRQTTLEALAGSEDQEFQGRLDTATKAIAAAMSELEHGESVNRRSTRRSVHGLKSGRQPQV